MMFENDAYKVEGTEEPGCRLALKVHVKPAAAKKAYKQAVKRVNKEISIPGFRKGKAPDQTVITRYGSYVDQEWKEILVNDAYKAALDLTKIYPMSRDSIEKPKIEQCSDEEGAHVTLAYEHYPNVPEVDFASIQLPAVEKSSVTQDQIDEIVEEIRHAHADWEEIEGRGVQEGDYVELSIDAIDEDPPKEIVRDRRFEVSKEKMAGWLLKLILGQEKGASVEGTSELDENATEETKARFTPTKVRIKLEAIKKILLPDVTDALAQKAGAESQDDMMQKITQNLERQAEDEFAAKRAEALDDVLAKTYTFDVPASLVQAEQEQRLRERLQELKTQNVSDEEIQGKQKEIEAAVSAEVQRSLRLYFLGRQIAEQGKVRVTNEELSAELVRHMQQNPYLYGKDVSKEQSRDLVGRLSSSLMQRKARDYALSQIA